MSIKHIAAAHKTQLKTGFPQDLRCYIDFRQQEYPPLSASDDTYTLITSAENRPGSHDMTGGSAQYLLDLPDTLTIRALVRPEFAFDVASDQNVWSWYVSATQYLTLLYQASSDTFVLAWRDGGTERTMSSQQFDDGTSFDDIDEDLVIDCVLDLTTGTAAGSSLYVNRTEQDTSWSGVSDVRSTNFPILELRGENGTEGNFSLNHVRVFLSKEAAAADVANDFQTLKEEEIYWPLDGHGLGQTRCAVRARVLGFALERSVIDQFGKRTSNRGEIALSNPNGEFSDDQFGAFDAANEVYNGTSAQAFMHDRCPVIVEHWHSNTYETVLRGRLDDNKFRRDSRHDNVPLVQLTVLDGVDDIERRVVINGVSYEDYAMSDTATPAASLVHVLARLATQRNIKNYLANSSFENATIGNSWADDANVTLAQAAGGLFGSNEANASTTAADEEVFQTVNFTGDKKLNPEETWTFSIYMKAAAAITGTIYLEERDSVGANDSTSQAFSITANEHWVRVSVSHTITDPDSDRLRVRIAITTTGQTLELDAAMLTQTREALNWFVLNDNDGAAGVESADDADQASYDTVGFDVDDVAVVHPWVLVEKLQSPWKHLRKLAAATLGQYLGMDAAGTLKYRSRMATGYADPSALETIDSTKDIRSVLEEQAANHIIVRGVKITKFQSDFEVWRASATGHFATTTDGSKLNENVANGADWPDPTVYPQYFARYEDEVEK